MQRWIVSVLIAKETSLAQPMEMAMSPFWWFVWEEVLHLIALSLYDLKLLETIEILIHVNVITVALVSQNSNWFRVFGIIKNLATTGHSSESRNVLWDTLMLVPTDTRYGTPVDIWSTAWYRIFEALVFVTHYPHVFFRARLLNWRRTTICSSLTLARTTRKTTRPPGSYTWTLGKYSKAHCGFNKKGKHVTSIDWTEHLIVKEVFGVPTKFN